MMVMPSNNCKAEVHYWQGLYGGLGHLYAPGGERGPYAHLPYALDNGAFGAFTRQESFDTVAFLKLLEWSSVREIEPLWVVVPDEVGEPRATLEKWSEWAPRIRDNFGYQLALAVQDGMVPKDIERLTVAPDVLFVGGSIKWKWKTMPLWCETHPRVHIGRVNSPERLYRCWDLGVESVDGTGWFRGDQAQLEGLRRFLELQSDGALEAACFAREPMRELWGVRS